MDKRIQDTLNATGLPWTLANGRKHKQIRLSGKLVGILPTGTSSDADKRVVLNVCAQIRRASKELSNGR